LKETTQRHSQPRRSQTDHAGKSAVQFASGGKLFQIVEPSFEKALCCLVSVRERGIT